MKIKSLFKTLALIAAVTTSVALTACGEDDEPKAADAEGPVATHWSAELTFSDKAADQNIMSTELTTPVIKYERDVNGELHRYEESSTQELLTLSMAVSYSVESSGNVLPEQRYFIITNRLKGSADLTQKDEYSVGMCYTLVVSSFDADGNIIDTKEEQIDTKGTLLPADLDELDSRLERVGFTYDIDEKGKITIESYNYVVQSPLSDL